MACSPIKWLPGTSRSFPDPEGKALTFLCSLPPVGILGMKGIYLLTDSALHSIPVNQWLPQDPLVTSLRRNLLCNEEEAVTSALPRHRPTHEKEGTRHPMYSELNSWPFHLSLDLGQHLFPLPGAAIATFTLSLASLPHDSPAP